MIINKPLHTTLFIIVNGERLNLDTRSSATLINKGSGLCNNQS